MILLVGFALADAIDMAPYDCPRGSEGQSNHNGGWCEVSTCSDDSECTSGMVCSQDAIGLCTETVTMDCGGLWGGENGCTETRNPVHHRCGPKGECVEGTCEKSRRCAWERTAPVTSSLKRKRGCATSAFGGLLLALAGLLGRVRR